MSRVNQRAFKIYSEKDVVTGLKPKHSLGTCEPENDYDTEEEEIAKQIKLSARRIDFAIKNTWG